jgi:hypothetical protein
MKVKFKQWDCIAQGAYYGNERRAIELIDAEDGEPIATASVNLPDEILHENCIFIKDYAENAGMVIALIEAGIILKYVQSVAHTGYVSIASYLLTEEAMERLWPKK